MSWKRKRSSSRWYRLKYSTGWSRTLSLWPPHARNKTLSGTITHRRNTSKGLKAIFKRYILISMSILRGKHTDRTSRKCISIRQGKDPKQADEVKNPWKLMIKTRRVTWGPWTALSHASLRWAWKWVRRSSVSSRTLWAEILKYPTSKCFSTCTSLPIETWFESSGTCTNLHNRKLNKKRHVRSSN